MRTALLLGTVSALAALAQADTPPYQNLPSFKIDLDLHPSQRFVEVTTALKPQITKMCDDYLHLTPGFVRDFFEKHENIIKMRHLGNYEEVVSIANIIEMPTYITLMLNYAFELGDALCTSVVARQADGTVIHGRNMDFAFPDAMRNATYIGQFYKNGKHLYDAVMFGGYTGVASASRAGQYTFTLNARNVIKSVEEYFTIMGEIFEGRPEIGLATRDAIEQCADYDCMINTWSAMTTVVPMYLIIAGTSPNQGAVISKDPKGVANVRTLTDDTWYLLQTNDDHFAGVCQQRCQDGNEHIQAVG
jgi:hypothetical protein